MARVNRMSVQKRLRERKKAEKAELKREQRLRREPSEEGGSGGQVATRADLEGYGLIVESDEERSESE